MLVRSVDVGGETLTIQEFGSDRTGPTLAVLGGVHGDEWEGIVAARMFAAALLPQAERLRGRVRLVAVSNPPAHRALSRTSPADGGNLARSFPGAADGTITPRLAHALTHHVIAGADLLVDLHSAGAHYEMPVFAGYATTGPTGEVARAAAHAFGAPIVWRHETIAPGRSLNAAIDLGVAAVYVEGSGGGGLRGRDLDIYLDGLHRLLVFLGLTDDAVSPPPIPLVIDEGNGDVDSSLVCTKDGLCVTRVSAGDLVATGAILAEIVDDEGHVVEQVRSPWPAHVMMLRRTAVIQAGDGIAMLAPYTATKT